MIDYDALFSEVGRVYYNAVRWIETEDYQAIKRLSVRAAPDDAMVLITRLTRSATRRGIEVRYEDWPEPCRLGYYNSDDGVIGLNANAPLTKRAYSLMHETCHSLDPDLPRYSLMEDAFGSPRVHQTEIATDAANVLLCAEYGIDALDYGAHYIAAHRHYLTRFDAKQPTRERILTIYDAVRREMAREERSAA